MKRSETAALVAMLKAAYPRAQFEEATLKLYEAMLSDLDVGRAQSAVKRLIATSHNLPTISDVRREAARTGQERPGIEAWSDVRAAMSAVGHLAVPRFRDPLVATAVDRLGWQNLCASRNSTADRARFAELYDSLASRQQERRQLGDVAPAPALSAPDLKLLKGDE